MGSLLLHFILSKGPFIAHNSTQLNWTQLNSTRQREQQLTQFVGRDVINKNTWLYAVQLGQLSWVELSCVAINTPLHHMARLHCTISYFGRIYEIIPIMRLHCTAIRRCEVRWRTATLLTSLCQTSVSWSVYHSSSYPLPSTSPSPTSVSSSVYHSSSSRACFDGGSSATSSVNCSIVWPLSTGSPRSVIIDFVLYSI